MNKPEFLEILRTFPGISAGNAQAVLELKEVYPFSQVLHALAARVSKDHRLTDSSRELQLAAVYAADRATLKNIMEKAADTVETTPAPISESPVLTKRLETGHLDYAEELIHDMERLNQLRNNFELLFVDGAATSFPVTPPPAPVEVALIPEQPQIIENIDPAPEVISESSDKPESPKSRKERIRELAKTVSGEGNLINESRGRKKRKDSSETLIDQIAVTKEELLLESEKQKQQIELIDHFIKAKPTITGTREKPAAAEDLSTIKAGDFTESIISETLVEILLKQGKKEKAVEVLKKLIWKFPQKKAYFASQIEELKK